MNGMKPQEPVLDAVPAVLVTSPSRFSSGVRLRLATIVFVFVLTGTLAALDWESGPGYRRAKLQPVGAGKDGFTLLLPEQTRIVFTNFLSEERALGSQILPSGSGVAAGDVDGDGWCDLYFCGLKTGNRLYRNLGNWKFEDITQRAGVACTNLDATGAALVDVDGNGSLDLIVNSVGGGTHVFLNDGRGRFTEAGEVLNQGKGGMSLGLADYDSDGRLDLYVANYRVASVSDDPQIRYNLKTIDGRLVVASINGRPLTDPEWTNRFRFQFGDQGDGRVKFSHEELGEADALYRNLGGGRFELVPWTAGSFLDESGKPLAQPPFDWGLSVMFRDLNGDGKPDLYICNDFLTPDRLWLNDGQGHFRALAPRALRQTPLSSMAVDVADVNRDGFDDLFVVDMLSREHRRRLVQRTNLRPQLLPSGGIDDRPQYARNMLQLNRGDGTYAEIAQYGGVEASEWSWTPIFLDVDLDGYEDLLVVNGFLRDNMNLDAMAAFQASGVGQRGSFTRLKESRKTFPRLATANLAFRNLGNLKFVECGHQWGFDLKAISQGMCLADLDKDGDMDVVINNLDTVAGVYRNDGTRPRVAVSLEGRAPNARGIGARIWCFGGAVPRQSQQMIAGCRYLSSDEPMRVFAAGSADSKDMRLEVEWPSGRRSVVRNVAANYLYEIDEESSKAEPRPSAVKVVPFFEDASALLGHSHHEELFDDFARQPTLSKRLSQLGPGVCWCDLNNDGREDLVVTGGKGGSMGVFVNDGRGGFRPWEGPLAKEPLTRDQTAVVAWPRDTNALALLTGSANYEDGQSAGASVLSWDLAAGKMAEAVPGLDGSIGPLALGDLDGDGTLELFVGGRVKTANYPEAGGSRIYRYREGVFSLDENNSKVVERVGMASAAVFSDLDGDGYPELIIACEWGPLKVFRNDRGRLAGWDPALSMPDSNYLAYITPRDSSSTNMPSLTLSRLTGWWNGVTTCDLDSDGRLDVVASNWGENSKYQGHRTGPLGLYYADFNQEGVLGLLQSYFEPAMGKYVPEQRLDFVARGLPFLRGQFPSYQAFADAGVQEVLGERFARTRHLDAAWLESTAFLNRGDHWEVRVLPAEAQFAPAFAVVGADFDGDGCEDIFLSQNFFPVEPETSRYDAGRGLWLRGDGKGGLQPVNGDESGVTVYGDQRGAAVADFDGDGRIDLAVTQNAAQTRLFRNVRAKPGLRVRLKGPPANPQGLGAQIRLIYGARTGPVREIHGASGYWSVDSPVMLMGYLEPPTRLWVRWPGGRTVESDLPANALEVEMSVEGKLVQLR